MMFWDQVGDYISADFLKLCNCGDLFMFQEYSGHCSSQELMTAWLDFNQQNCIVNMQNKNINIKICTILKPF